MVVDKSSEVRQDLIRGLIAILSLGIQENELEDSELLLDAIKTLSPGLKGIDEFSAYIAIKRGFIQEALHMFAAAPTEDSKWFVMMALCLKLSGDPTWHWHATQSLERNDPTALYAHNLARILLGEDAPESVGTDDVSTSATAAAATSNPAQQLPNPYTNYIAI